VSVDQIRQRVNVPGIRKAPGNVSQGRRRYEKKTKENRIPAAIAASVTAWAAAWAAIRKRAFLYASIIIPPIKIAPESAGAVVYLYFFAMSPMTKIGNISTAAIIPRIILSPPDH
jgi:hypothetical protein